MRERRRILLLTLIMLAVAVGVAAIAISALYEVGFEQQRARLVETVQSHARLMEAVARFDAQYSTEDVPGGAFAATLGQIRDAHARFKGFGETGEFLLAKREGDWIVFLLSHRHLDLDNPKPVPFSSEFAEPMRRALAGESGSMVGLDYRGETVLAAYEPVAELDLGIVAKIDLAEVRAPFINAGLMAAGGGLVLIFVGTALFWRVSNPFIRALRESEARFRSLADNLPGAVFQRKLTPEGRLAYTYISPRVRDLYGLEPQDIVADASVLLDAMPVEDRDRWMAALEHSAPTLSPMDLQVRVIAADGATCWIHTISSPTRDENGEVVWDGVDIDITERKRAEEALRESEERYRELFELSPTGIWEEDYSGAKRMIDRLREEGVRDFRSYFREYPKVLRQAINAIKIIDVNQALLDAYRAPDKETFVQWEVNPARIDSWMSFYEQGFAALAEGETRFALEHADKAFDGSDIIVRVITHIGEAHKDNWARVVSTTEDITERKRREQEGLRESEQRYRELFEQSPIGIWEEDYSAVKPMIDRLRRKGVRDFRRHFREHPEVISQIAKAIKIIDVNQALLDLYRVPDKETYLRAAAEPARINHWRSFYEEELAALAEGESRFTLEYADQALDGSPIVARVITHIGEAYKDSWARVISTAEDITERIHMEQQLRQAQKMEAIGELSGGIAHDFNNLLTIVLGNLELLDEHLGHRGDLEGDVQEFTHAASKAALRGAELTQRLLAFGRRQPLRPSAIDLNALVSGMTSLLTRTLGETIAIDTPLAVDLWHTLVDPGQLEHALLNLTINARDAMPNGGKLAIETANAQLDEEYVKHEAEVAPGNYVMLSVSDTGTGMPPEVVERAVEPFFTTKETGQGSGLGLSMVYGFVKQSGGHIKICSEVGRGTTVKLFLPKVEGDSVRAGPDSIAGQKHPSGGETILVVEDDADVRKLAVRLLEDLGYKVLEACDGREALTILGQGGHVDLVLADLVLPGGLSGIELVREARRRRPALKVLYTSGYSKHTAVDAGASEEVRNLLTKPFDKGGLAREVRSVLDEKRG